MHHFLRFAFITLVPALFAFACAEDRPPASDAGRDASTDASIDASTDPPMDATVADASHDAWVPPLPDATPGSETARCIGLATALRDRCDVETDATRRCSWHAYAALCASGATATLIDAMECLGATGCAAFSDPNGADECLAAVHADADGTPRYAGYSSLVSGCGATPSVGAFATSEIFPYLGDDDAAALGSCAGTLCSLASIAAACSDEIAAIGAFACGG